MIESTNRKPRIPTVDSCFDFVGSRQHFSKEGTEGGGEERGREGKGLVNIAY